MTSARPRGCGDVPALPGAALGRRPGVAAGTPWSGTGAPPAGASCARSPPSAPEPPSRRPSGSCDRRAFASRRGAPERDPVDVKLRPRRDRGSLYPPPPPFCPTAACGLSCSRPWCRPAGRPDAAADEVRRDMTAVSKRAVPSRASQSGPRRRCASGRPCQGEPVRHGRCPAGSPRGGQRRRGARVADRGVDSRASREPPREAASARARRAERREAPRGGGDQRAWFFGESSAVCAAARSLAPPSDPGWFRAEANPPAAGGGRGGGRAGGRGRGRGRRVSAAPWAAGVAGAGERAAFMRAANGKSDRTPTWPPGDARRGSAACPRTPTREAPCPAAWTRGKSEATSSSARTCAAAGREVPSRARDASETFAETVRARSRLFFSPSARDCGETVIDPAPTGSISSV